MVILLLLAIVLCGVAVMAAIRTIAFGGMRRSETLSQINAYGFEAAEVGPKERRSVGELVQRFVRSVGELPLRHFDSKHEVELRAMLRAAGYYNAEPATFLGSRICFAVVVPLAWLLLLADAGALGARALLGIVMLGGLGWVMPKFLLERKATKRLEDIDRETPELVDLLVTTVEAGVGFASALQLVSRRVEGPLGQELRLALQEQSMGLTIEDALQHMLSRVDSASVRAFVQAIQQGQILGVSIGKILRDLAVDMRKRRRQLAEERAQKAPTKLLFPLVFLILPALMIVALGGPLLGLMHSLGSS
jgi:tight adherence protein C